ncbi:hypothetical protein [Actinomadura madurae]|nr:hypothetical protein [Actinomadura madurae]
MSPSVRAIGPCSAGTVPNCHAQPASSPAARLTSALPFTPPSR